MGFCGGGSMSIEEMKDRYYRGIGIMSREEMKNRLVDKQIDYLKDLISKDKPDELFLYVCINFFDNFESMSDEEILEEYEWIAEEYDEPFLKI
tara:strand:+ start:30 stop:308 length:279 start_codon:yes stop_codon:yes gene_type:complete